MPRLLAALLVGETHALPILLPKSAPPATRPETAGSGRSEATQRYEPPPEHYRLIDIRFKRKIRQRGNLPPGQDLPPWLWKQDARGRTSESRHDAAVLFLTFRPLSSASNDQPIRLRAAGA